MQPIQHGLHLRSGERLGTRLGHLLPGGRLVYSTCSLEDEEGTILVNSWLRSHPEFVLDREVSLFPPESGTDGIYAARLKRSIGKQADTQGRNKKQ